MGKNRSSGPNKIRQRLDAITQRERQNDASLREQERIRDETAHLRDGKLQRRQPKLGQSESRRRPDGRPVENTKNRNKHFALIRKRHPNQELLMQQLISAFLFVLLFVVVWWAIRELTGVGR
jgi:hypothetical protein